MTPTEKHRETAAAVATKAIGGCMFETADNWTAQKDWATEVIATALAKAEREGMKRAAEIARGSSGEFDFQSALAEGRDFDYGFHNGKNHAADSILAAIILSEAGEGV